METKFYLSQISSGSDFNLIKASLLQKLIRRGMVREALHIGNVYLKLNQHKGLRRRLEIICAEDIGFGWLDSSKFMKENDDLLLIIQNLCLAPKNRESDRFLLCVANNHKELLQSKDKSVIHESRVLLRLFQLSSSWFNDKNKNTLKELNNAFKKMSENQKHGEIIKILGENYISLTKNKVHGARCQLALASLIYSRKWDKDFSFTPLTSLIYEPLEFDEIFDFAIDMHTPLGKKLNRDFNHWANNCVVVSPEIDYPELYDSSNLLKYPLINKK